VQYSAEAVERLLELSGNHPYFLQSLCRFAYANGAATGRITRQHVEDAIHPCMEAIRNGFESIWRDVKDDEKVILSTTAHMESLYLTMPDIVGQLEYWRIDWPLPKVKNLVRQVERKEFLERTEFQHYRYYAPFFEHCIRTYQPIDVVLDTLKIPREQTLSSVQDLNFFKAEKNLRDAEEFAHAGDLQKAEQTFHFVLETYPDYPGSWLRFGMFYESCGKWDEALELYQQRLKDRPDSVESSNAIALLLKRRYRFQDALEQFRTSLDIQADNPIALANIEEIEYWLALDSEEQRLDYCLIPIVDELRRLEQTIDDLNAQERSHGTTARLRQCRARARRIERKLQDLQAQFPSENLESRLSQ
jgi:tetratricopeptide (TPR) repeat protein